MTEAQYFTYILACADDSLYTGWTVNLQKRLQAHNQGTASRYTRVRLPVSLVASWSLASKTEAMRLEWKIKQLSRTQKMALIQQQENAYQLL